MGVEKNKIFDSVGGGLDLQAGMTAVEVYDSTTDTWMKGVDLQTPRFGLATAVADGKIYATGGGHFGQPLSTLEVYDTGFEGNAQSVNPAGKLPTLWGKLKAR